MKEIEEDAAQWLTRIDRAPLTSTESASLAEWLAGSPRHLGAFVRAQAILAAAEQSVWLEHEDVPAQKPYVSRRRIILAGTGAAAAAAIGVAFVKLSDPPYTTYRAARGEVRLVPMADGTVATLNTETEIAVRITRTERTVHLISGEAFFIVAKDRVRPFTVHMNDTVVRAVGTAFIVRKLKNEPAQVLVGEGAVDMFRQSVKASAPLRVPANSRAASLEVPYPTIKMLEENLDPALVARQLAWREGMISFEGQTLREAAQEFARYSDVRIIIDDPAVAKLTVVGLFSANNPLEFADSVAAVLNLQAKETAAGVMLYR